MKSMKYITVDDGMNDNVIIFPLWMEHKSIHNGVGGDILGAGMVSFQNGKAVCHGHSQSLGVNSRPEDAELLNAYFGLNN